MCDESIIENKQDKNTISECETGLLQFTSTKADLLTELYQKGEQAILMGLREDTLLSDSEPSDDEDSLTIKQIKKKPKHMEKVEKFPKQDKLDKISNFVNKQTDFIKNQSQKRTITLEIQNYPVNNSNQINCTN